LNALSEHQEAFLVSAIIPLEYSPCQAFFAHKQGALKVIAGLQPN
jgi:hypothetical protein